jgi:lipid II:glycine glycyltransferase (peptidoglycan interpeptide bridge formation enzyme)
MFRRFASSVRRAIRKSDRNGVNAVAVRNRQAVGEFYQLHVETRRRHGLPPQSASFFRNIYEHILKPGLGFVVLAQRRSRTIAAAIFFRFGNNAIYKYAASDKRFQEFRANNLVMWHGIQLLMRLGVEKIHFGRCERENDGLRRFKLSWGTQEQLIDYYRIDPSGRLCFSPARRDSHFHKKVFGSFPLMFNRVAGSIIYPHLD